MSKESNSFHCINVSNSFNCINCFKPDTPKRVCTLNRLGTVGDTCCNSMEIMCMSQKAATRSAALIV